MGTPEQLFIRELEVFRTEAQTGAQFLYAYLSFNSIISEKKKIYKEINTTPLFWNTTMGSLQTSFFIVLGRIFDQNSTHNIDSLIKIAQDNKNIFSKKALANRKKKDSPNADEWLDEYLKSVYEPTAKDFRELRKKVKEFRKIYESNYRDIRRKIYAHKEVSDAEEIQKLFSKTNIRELQRVFIFVNALYEALWQLLYNGRKPVLRRMRYSVRSMVRDRKPKWQSQTVQERLVGEVSDFHRILTINAQQGAQHGRAKKRRAS
jgi:predicted translin family RNA/ssDNA-binding protein